VLRTAAAPHPLANTETYPSPSSDSESYHTITFLKLISWYIPSPSSDSESYHTITFLKLISWYIQALVFQVTSDFVTIFIIYFQKLPEVTVQALGHLLEEEQPAMVQQTTIYHPFYHNCNHVLLTHLVIFDFDNLFYSVFFCFL
jgi:hypothetical protein